MEFLELTEKRRSIRKYRHDTIPKKDLEYILESTRMAPSWGNRQCWKFIVVTDTAKRKAIAGRDWIGEAPAIIVGCANPNMSGSKFNQQYYMLDMGIAMEHMMLAAAELGLGTCWIGGQFEEDTVKQVLGIPADVRVVALTPIGYPAERPNPKGRKELSEIVSYDTW